MYPCWWHGNADPGPDTVFTACRQKVGVSPVQFGKVLLVMSKISRHPCGCNILLAFPKVGINLLAHMYDAFGTEVAGRQILRGMQLLHGETSLPHVPLPAGWALLCATILDEKLCIPP